MIGDCVKDGDRWLAWWRGRNQHRTLPLWTPQHQVQGLGAGLGSPAPQPHPIPPFNFIKGNFPPAPPCPGARIHSSAHILKRIEFPETTIEFPRIPFEFPTEFPILNTQNAESRGVRGRCSLLYLGTTCNALLADLP